MATVSYEVHIERGVPSEHFEMQSLVEEPPAEETPAIPVVERIQNCSNETLSETVTSTTFLQKVGSWGWHLLQKGSYSFGLAYTVCKNSIRGYNDLNCIVPGLYLGMQPIYYRNHGQQLKELNVTHKLSILQEHERDSWIFATINEIEGVEAKNVEAEDRKPVPYEQLKEAVEYIHNIVSHNGILLVHCKAGVGRSASCVLAYLMLYHEMTYEEAFSMVSEIHPQINMSAEQAKAIKDFVERYKNEKKQKEDENKRWQEELTARLPKENVSPGDR